MNLNKTDKTIIEIMRMYSDSDGFVYSDLCLKIIDSLEISKRQFDRIIKKLIDNDILLVHSNVGGRGIKRILRLKSRVDK